MIDIEKNNYDVAIVGAGPAGSSAAIRLAQNGLKVLLDEQKKFPRSKLCGEFISPECLTHFSELNVLGEMSDSGGVTLDRTVFYARNGRSLTVPSEWFGAGSHALGLSRAEMDLRLLERARAAGADVLEETQAVGLLSVSSPHVSKGSSYTKERPYSRAGICNENDKICGVLLRNKARETFNIKAAVTIDATGRARILTRQIEKANDRATRNRADFVAFKTHLEGANIPDGDCEIYAYRGGYGGCGRVENGRSNLCFIVSAKIAKQYGGDAAEIMKKIVFKNDRAKRSLCYARTVKGWLAVPIESYGRAALSPADGLLTIGDAAAFIDPFTGSGILLALESAKIAACVITNEFSKAESERSFTVLARNYQTQYAAAFDRRFRISSFVRRAAFVPFFAETVIKTLSLSHRLTRHLARATRPLAHETHEIH